VETTQSQVPVLSYPNYGIVRYQQPVSVQPSPIALKSAPILANMPVRPDPGDPLQSLAVVNTAPVERFVSQDPYIARALGTTGVVSFNGTPIGATGGLANQAPLGLRRKA
jgi:hypothetical protein